MIEDKAIEQASVAYRNFLEQQKGRAQQAGMNLTISEKPQVDVHDGTLVLTWSTKQVERGSTEQEAGTTLYKLG